MDECPGALLCQPQSEQKQFESGSIAGGNRIRERVNSRVKTLLGADHVFFRVPWLLRSPK